MKPIEQEFIQDSPWAIEYKETLKKFDALVLVTLDLYSKIQANNNIIKGIAGQVELFR